MDLLDYISSMATATGTVLYVEDDPSHAYMMQKAFIRAGLTDSFQTTPDAPAAVSYLEGSRTFCDRTKYPLPKVVIVDLKLPQMDGLELLGWIRTQPKLRDLPVVVFSVSQDESDQKTAKALRADDYWVKPQSADEFPRFVEQVKRRWLP